MKVILATQMGMCFGVRDAIAETRNTPNPNQTTIYGELVHNRQVVDELRLRGFAMTPETTRDDIPPTPQILITAHGISNKEHQRLANAGKILIDTTCPLVHRIHAAAQKLERDGYFVVVIGKHNHVEVRGIVDDLRNYAVVDARDEVQCFDSPRVGIVCQSTTPPSHADAMRREIETKNIGKEICFIDTICHPTRARQEAVLALFGQVDALVVVGGRNSNNTRQLANLATEHGIPALHVERPDDLNPDWFKDFSIVGLTAGTSTPDHTIRAIHKALLSIRPQGRTESRLARICVALAAVPLRLVRSSFAMKFLLKGNQ